MSNQLPRKLFVKLLHGVVNNPSKLESTNLLGYLILLVDTHHVAKVEAKRASNIAG